MEETVTNAIGGDVVGGFDLADYLRVKAELKKRVVADTVKSLGNNKGVWRQRLVMRRVDVTKYASDDDLVAYSSVHKLKNPTGDSRQKVTVTDNEITAYKVLDPDFNKPISLAEVMDKVAELKSVGQLTAAGDNAANGEDTAED